MSREVFDGNYKVHWLTACANTNAPTEAEIAAGTYIGKYATRDGVALNVTQGSVDTAGIDSLWDTQIGGTAGMTPELTLFRDGDDETDGWDLVEQGAEGFLLVSSFGAPEAGSKVIVVPAEMGIGKPTNSAGNEAQKFTVSFFMREPPSMKAVVAG